MSESICTFISAPKPDDTLTFINFVYETEFHKLKMPLFRSTYGVYLVTSGSGVYNLWNRDHKLSEGSLFFMFPGYTFRLSGSEDLRYMYITLIGTRVAPLLERAGATPKTPVFDGIDGLADYWMSELLSIGEKNADVIAESVFMRTMAHIMASSGESGDEKSRRDDFSRAKEYIDVHYADGDISLNKVSDMFFYNPKYFSGLFKKKTGVGLNGYLRALRVRRARELFAGGVSSVNEVAQLCGYADPLYFSKVFKKETGKSPVEYLKETKGGV